MVVKLFKKAIFKIGRETSLRIGKKKAYFPANKKVISFTFDDFPITAAKIGSRLLEDRNVCGTFYTSLGLAERERPVGWIGSQESMLALSQKGHEIGCHTFSHLNCAFKSPKMIRADCRKNQDVAKHLAGISFKSFAYPFGGFDPISKDAISKMYHTARTVIHGINLNEIDLAALKSVDLYENVGWSNILCWIEKIDEEGGWLILSTHDISKAPSQFGCSVKLFERTLDLSLKKGFQISTVRQVESMLSIVPI